MTIRIGIIGEEVAVEAGRDMIVIDPTEVRGNATEVGVVVLVLTAVKIVGGEEMMMNDVVLANLIEACRPPGIPLIFEEAYLREGHHLGVEAMMNLHQSEIMTHRMISQSILEVHLLLNLIPMNDPYMPMP